LNLFDVHEWSNNVLDIMLSDRYSNVSKAWVRIPSMGNTIL